MKKINGDRLYLGIFLLAAGIFLTFAMGFISALLYIAGAGLIIYNIFHMAVGITNDKSKIYVPKGIAGIIIGIVMILLPKFIKIGLPVVAGLFFLITGVTGLFNAIEKHENDAKKKFSGILSSVLLAICGIFILTNPAKISGWIVKIVSIVFILAGIAIIFSVLVKKRKSDEIKDVIEINDFKIED